MTQKEEKMEEGRAESRDAVNSPNIMRIWAMKERIKTRLKKRRSEKSNIPLKEFTSPIPHVVISTSQLCNIRL